MGKHHVVRRQSRVAARTKQNVNCALCTTIIVGTFALLPLFAVPVPLTEWAHIAQVATPPSALAAAPPQPPSELPLRHIRALHPGIHATRESLVADTQPLFELPRLPAMHELVPSTHHRLRLSNPDSADRHTDRGSHVDHTDFGHQNSDHDSPEHNPHDSSDDHHGDGSSHDGGHEHGGDSHDGHGDSHGGSHGSHEGSHSGGHGGGSHGSHGGGHGGKH